MLRGRSRLPLLAEIEGPADGRAWALRRTDFASLREALPRLTERRVLAVVGEGEAPAAAAIAVAAAATASGRGTILVDCDLARPRLAGSVGLAASPGLHEYLRWEAEPRDVLQPVSLAGSAAGDGTAQLVCFAAGRPAAKSRDPARPAELCPHGRQAARGLRAGAAPGAAGSLRTRGLPGRRCPGRRGRRGRGEGG